MLVQSSILSAPTSARTSTRWLNALRTAYSGFDYVCGVCKHAIHRRGSCCISRGSKTSQVRMLTFWGSYGEISRFLWWHSEVLMVKFSGSYDDILRFLWWNSQVLMMTFWGSYGEILRFLRWHSEVLMVMLCYDDNKESVTSSRKRSWVRIN